jgi:hypothetical protein
VASESVTVSVPEKLVPLAGLNTGVATVPAGGLIVVAVLMVKLVLVAEVRLGLLADRVSVPAVLTVRLLKVATPFCGVAVNVPPRPVPPTRASVIGLVAEVTGFPLLSSTATVTAGEMVAPVKALVGCCTKASFAGGRGGLLPAVMLKPALVAGVRLGLVAESV